MSNSTINRRNALKFMGVAAGASVLQKATAAIPEVSAPANPAFTYCLNMATIRGHNLDFVTELQTASKAGFRSVEIWVDRLQAYLAKGNTLAQAKRVLNDTGIKIENDISFCEWIADDETTRKSAIELMKREMDMMAELGCKRIAATAKGINNANLPSLDVIAERYRTILDLSDKTGVVPLLEMWGFQKPMNRVSECLYIAMESGHPSATILLDIFHLFKGNTSLDTLKLMNPIAVDVLHMNDHTANFRYQDITDADRVYPGDGVAPIKRILKILKRHDKPLVLSTEVFNKEYYKQDPLLVCQTALAKMKTVTQGV